MTGLVAFANSGGLGLDHPIDFFQWNNGGTGGALDLHNGAMGGDCGYYPQWENYTIGYLGDPDPDTGRGTVHRMLTLLFGPGVGRWTTNMQLVRWKVNT